MRTCNIQYDFNSRTHVECDTCSMIAPWAASISTHALTWSATLQKRGKTRKQKISTHALTWSATIRWRNRTEEERNFNSRTHVECDWRRIPAEPIVANFNSRTHVECDQQKNLQLTISLIFQLTHSRGVRPSAISQYLGGTNNFNSRTHVECDILISSMIPHPIDFNSRTHVECDLFLP